MNDHVSKKKVKSPFHKSIAATQQIPTVHPTHETGRPSHLFKTLTAGSAPFSVARNPSLFVRPCVLSRRLLHRLIPFSFDADHFTNATAVNHLLRSPTPLPRSIIAPSPLDTSVILPRSRPLHHSCRHSPLRHQPRSVHLRHRRHHPRLGHHHNLRHHRLHHPAHRLRPPPYPSPILSITPRRPLSLLPSTPAVLPQLLTDPSPPPTLILLSRCSSELPPLLLTPPLLHFRRRLPHVRCNVSKRLLILDFQFSFDC